MDGGSGYKNDSKSRLSIAGSKAWGDTSDTAYGDTKINNWTDWNQGTSTLPTVAQPVDLINIAFTIEYYSQKTVTDLQTPYMSIYFHINVDPLTTQLDFGSKPSGTFTSNSGTYRFDCGALPITKINDNTYRYTMSAPMNTANITMVPLFYLRAWGTNVGGMYCHQMRFTRMPVYYGWT